MLYIYTRKKKKTKKEQVFCLVGSEQVTIENDIEKAEVLQPFFALLKKSKSIQTIHRLQILRT